MTAPMKTDSIGRVLGPVDSAALLYVVAQLPEPPERRYSSQVSVQVANARRMAGKAIGPHWWMIQAELDLKR